MPAGGLQSESSGRGGGLRWGHKGKERREKEMEQESENREKDQGWGALEGG